MLVAVAVIATLVALAFALGHKGTGPKPPNGTHLSAGEANFAELLATSASAHDLVVAAVIGSCESDAPAAASRQSLIAGLNRAIELRVSVLNGTAMDRLAISAMPEGPLLLTELDQATDASLKVDEDYAAWLVDLQATGCFSAPTNDLHYLAATDASPAATQADENLAGTWAPLAARAHLRVWAADQL
ncbi:MAG TPA: hypothetical protein VEJ84_17535 [Acidimicrobiales bacterium]|nr:hypothetical protein [Acidimicrobiales bacterium]